eukprot:g26362.t1
MMWATRRQMGLGYLVGMDKLGRREEISDAKDRTKSQIDRLIQFLQNEKERLMIDMQHVGNDHLDSIHGLQAEATHRLEHCENTMQS